MQHAVERAVDHLSAHPDTDIFPVPLDGIELFQDREKAIASVLKLHHEFDTDSIKNPPELIRSLVPAGYDGYRLGTQIPPLWNAYYLALVIASAPEIERIRAPVNSVCSYRFQDTGAKHELFDPRIGWMRFTDCTLERCQHHDHVLITDISDFYHRIRLDALVQGFEQAKIDPDVSERLATVLTMFGIDRHGLPIGGPASRLLAELALNPLDHELTARGIPCVRFVDDLRAFAADEAQAHMHLKTISELAFKLGLSVQKNKTRVLRSRDLIEEIDFSKSMFVPVGPSTIGGSPQPIQVPIPHDPYSELKAQLDQRLATLGAKPEFHAAIKTAFTKSKIPIQSGRNLLSAMRFMEVQVLGNTLLELLKLSDRPAMIPFFGKLMSALDDGLFRLTQSDALAIRDLLLHLFTGSGVIIGIDLHRARILRTLCAMNSEPRVAIPKPVIDRLRVEPSALVRREAMALCIAWEDPSALQTLTTSIQWGPWEKPIALMQAPHIRSLIRSNADHTPTRRDAA